MIYFYKPSINHFINYYFLYDYYSHDQVNKKAHFIQLSHVKNMSQQITKAYLTKKQEKSTTIIEWTKA